MMMHTALELVQRDGEHHGERVSEISEQRGGWLWKNGLGLGSRD